MSALDLFAESNCIFLNIYVLYVVHWNGTSLTLCYNYDNFCILLKLNCNVFLILKKVLISTSYIKIILMVLWFCSMTNVFCSWIFLVVLFILWKGAEGARWRGVTYSQFIFCVVSLLSLGSLCFTHLSSSVLWNQYASFELQINLGWHLVSFSFTLHLYHWGF